MNENITIPNGVKIVSVEGNENDIPKDLLEGLTSVIGNTIGNLSYEEFAKNATKDENGTLHYNMNLNLDNEEET